MDRAVPCPPSAGLVPWLARVKSGSQDASARNRTNEAADPPTPKGLRAARHALQRFKP